MQNFEEQSGFTLLELIIVITIIGILATSLSLDFSAARQTQELASLADQSLALMQQTHANVLSGKSVEEEDEDGNILTTVLCEGAYFELGERIEYAWTNYNSDSGSCDWDTLESESYGLSPGGAVISGLTLGGVDVAGPIWGIFSPPDGNITFYSGTSEYVNDAVIAFGHKDKDELSVNLFISYLTQTIYLFQDDEDK